LTIAAAYLVSEGVVFGADSTTSISINSPEGSGVLQLLHHAQKVFEVGENSRLGVCTWGAGSIGRFSHRTIIAQLADKVEDDTFTIEEVAEALGNIVEPKVKEAQVDFAGYFLGGWNPDSHEPACFKVDVRPDGKKIESLNLGLCTFAGMPKFFNRVFRGFDPDLPENLRKELTQRIPEKTFEGNTFDNIFKEAFQVVSAPLLAAGYKDLPIREAIDFVHSYLHITVKTTKFMFGAPLCGGPIELGFVSTDRRFRWVRHKAFSTAIMEQEGEYDVE